MGNNTLLGVRMAWELKEVIVGSHKGEWAVMTDEPNNHWWIVGFFKGSQEVQAKEYMKEMKRAMSK